MKENFSKMEDEVNKIDVNSQQKIEVKLDKRLEDMFGQLEKKI